MSLPFDALRQSASGATARLAGATGKLTGSMSDGATGVLVIARNGAAALWRAQGETKLALAFATFLAVLACLPEHGVLPQASATGGIGSALENGVSGIPAYDREPWRAVAPKLAAWRLESPQLPASGVINRLRSLPDGSRQELLVWNAGAANRLSGALSLEHYADRAPEADSLYVETVRRAALSGASIDRMAQTVPMETKFGPFETADAAVDAGNGPLQCIAFRQIAADAPARIMGWFCGSGQPLDRSALSCLINRLDLVNSGDDAVLRGWFATAERNRNGCETGRPGSARWLDAGAKMPALKRDVTGSIPRTPSKRG